MRDRRYFDGIQNILHRLHGLCGAAQRGSDNLRFLLEQLDCLILPGGELLQMLHFRGPLLELLFERLDHTLRLLRCLLQLGEFAPLPLQLVMLTLELTSEALLPRISKIKRVEEKAKAGEDQRKQSQLNVNAAHSTSFRACDKKFNSTVRLSPQLSIVGSDRALTPHPLVLQP